MAQNKMINKNDYQNLTKEKLLAEIALWYNWIKTHG